MRARALAAALLAMALTAQVSAQTAPDRSPRPDPRPADAAPRAASDAAPAASPIAVATGLASSPRPPARPVTLRRRYVAQSVGVPETRANVPGPICGSAGIRGVAAAPIPGRIAGCGVERPVKVSMVGGVALSQAATMDCPTAQALERWVTGTVRPTLSGVGGGVARLEIAAHYSCRTRNNQPGAKVSEHGRGRAVDISGFRLADGRRITVLEGWSARGASDLLRRMHAGACGPFGTVLGPAADRYHRDHFHLDTARYRSGTYCR